MQNEVDRLATPVRQLWEFVRSKFYANNTDVCKGLSQEQVVSRVSRVRRSHYTGSVHGVVEVSLNVVPGGYGSSKPVRIIGWANPALVDLLCYKGTTEHFSAFPVGLRNASS
ncbi:TPA: hypothetical protein N0F65_000229 [Lagenidium giganteum]|uniref:Uncharacterized protein n=1 Tax=Lagenidium giganteum TaxID=4803 RepID=A0AAV2YDL8_9STRA|nr:TPA: hypothetical protein N0F65_000229 [Lagenidium giganteum]